MANTISYASKYAPELDKMITQKAVTGFFSDGGFKARFTGAKTVFLPELTTVGLGNYNAGEGYKRGQVVLKHTPYDLKMSRGRQILLDNQDMDESGVPDLTGQVVGEYTRNEIIPELDAYVLSTLYAIANEKGNITTYDSTKAVAQLLATINSVEAACEYGDTPLVAFVDPVLYGILQNSPEINRQLVVSDFKKGEVDFKVKHLNGVAILPVSSRRMKSEYIFADGSDASVGGFTPTETAKDVRAIVAPKDAVNLIKKVQKVDLLSPGEVEDFDAYKINFRLYYDSIVKESRKGTIFAIA